MYGIINCSEIIVKLTVIDFVMEDYSEKSFEENNSHCSTGWYTST